ncbi:GNAT family N-acetyltransferase [Actibacterium sp. 188UL27-1]|uniref:GNAT family N-acetyltransferase n=1 Tax=Actibacterium sp. 188UL27-1 TaxID=2786961 RepID=UPI00351C8B8A
MIAPTLGTNRLTLRMTDPRDWPAYRDYYTSNRSVGVGGPISAREAWHRFAGFWGHWAIHGFGRFTIVEHATGAPIGHVGPYMPEGHAEPELTWTLWTDAAEGRGIAHEAALTARNWCFDTLGWTTLTSVIDPANTRSAALATRLGAHREGPVTNDSGTFDLYRHPGPSQ